MSFNWKSVLLAVLKSLWPFVAGLLGGVASGCSMFGSGVSGVSVY